MRKKILTNPSGLPEGFLYRQEFLSIKEEQALLKIFEEVKFKALNFQGYVAKRRVIEYGLAYDFRARRTNATEAIPDYLQGLKSRAAELADVNPDRIAEAIVIEYSPGSPIGWHRDAPQFEIIIGISLGSSCRMRFKPYKGEGKIVSMVLEPRSAYVMRGPARSEFQHSIPAVEALRYSITFRTLRNTPISSARSGADRTILESSTS